MMKLKFYFLLLAIVTAANLYAQAEPPVLVAPENNSVRQKSENLQLVWELVPGFQEYQVQYSLNPAFSGGQTASIIAAGNQLTISRLRNDTLYYWRVRVNQQNSEWSEVWSFRTTELPVIPVPISPMDSSRNQSITGLEFTWTGDSINTNYLLQLSTNSNFLGTLLNFTTTDTSYIIPELNSNQTYFWRVQGYNVDGEPSEWSQVLSFKTGLAAPRLILPPDNARNQDTVVTILWETVIAAADYYFQLASDTLFTEQSVIAEADTNNNLLEIDSLEYHTSYYWRVLAYNENGDSSSWTETRSFRTGLQDLMIYTPADSSRNRDTVVTFTWDSVETATEYIFQLSEDTLNAPVFTDTTEALTLEIDSLNYNTRYFWKVIAANDSGDNSSSNFYTFKTMLEFPELLIPADSSRNISNEVEFSWEGIPGADEYKINIGYDSLFANIFIEDFSPDTLFSVDTLAFDTTYYWRVMGFNEEGDSSLFSEVFFFTTRPAILVSDDSIRVTINLSRERTDSLTTISVSNIGENLYNIDSVKIQPDSIFSVNRSSAVVMPRDTVDFEISFNSAEIDTGLTEGRILFIRNNFPVPDTLSVKLEAYIQKAYSTFSDSSLVFDSTDAGTTTTKIIAFRNYGGNIPLMIDSIAIIGVDTSAFTLTFDENRISANDSAYIEIEFEPQRLGMHNAELYIETNSFPDTLFVIPLSGAGRGGELSATSLNRIEELSDSLFEALTENDKPIVFKNNGNSPMNVSVEFAQGIFKVENDFFQNFIVKRGDSVTINVRYTIPDFEESNKDTMRIIHNGFGEDTLLVYLEGTFDSLASAQKIQTEMRLNGNQFSESDKIINENTQVNFTLDPELLNSYQNLRFRMNYYTGGNGKRISAENDGAFNFTIPKELVDERGLILTGQLLAYDERGRIADSINIIKPLNMQVVLKDYKTVDINVPRSVPAETEEAADTKWIMFGFPFDDVVADSVFKNFGGIENMKDGEWIIYFYNFTAPDSFSVFNNYYFTPNTAYFAAQSLLDTFKISYRYNQNRGTRKLTDTILTTPGTNWKTISSPFLFDVEVDPSVVLRRYDTNSKTYRMTNIMRPGEGYFVEPAVDRIIMKTYGEYNPLTFPKLLSDIGWHIKLRVQDADNSVSAENLFSIKNEGLLTKASEALPVEYAASPRLGKGLGMFITNGSNKLDAIVKEGIDGAVFDFTIFNDLKDGRISLIPEISGTMPENFTYKIYNTEAREVIAGSKLKNFYIKKDKKYEFKLLTGTEKYVSNALTELISQVPESFAISQNYPNPFNPVTVINYQIPKSDKQSVPVQVKVYDILGKEIKTLVNEEQNPGYYKISFDGSGFASGVYFYRITAGEFVSVKKMMLLK